MSSATVEEFVELLNAEQHVDLQKLRDLARHGVQPQVRGEVWLYLLGVLSDDKGQEMTSVRSKHFAYEALDKHNPALEKRVRSECQRYYQKRLGTRPPPGRTLMRSSRSVLSRRPGGFSAAGLGTNGVKAASLGRDYALEGLQSSQSLSVSGSSLGDGAHSAMGSNATALATANLNGAERGPNRVNDGRIHALGGIIGESGVSAAMDADDPDAAAALELKRFGRSVENIICAFMNRCTAAEEARRHAGEAIANDASLAPQTGSAAQRGGEASYSGSSSTQAGDSGQNEGKRGGAIQQRDPDDAQWEDDPFRSTKSGDASNGNDVFHDTDGMGGTISTHHAHNLSHKNNGTSSGLLSRAGSPSNMCNKNMPHFNTSCVSSRQNITLEECVRSRMPREYEWAPQILHSSTGSGGSGGGGVSNAHDAHGAA
uniref:Rab-GAP TBC domain-containing protein n=1 Tax=Melanopsichium pennsylvanicum 4 TaxID=1398559 RepID=A0A077R8G5_9BASI|nr:conserved hypothetical protein [Melanopsichium pennsylvanicum 4]